MNNNKKLYLAKALTEHIDLMHIDRPPSSPMPRNGTG